MTGDEFAGRVAVVTGGASGIGRATAELIALRGGTVAILDADPSATECATAIQERTGSRTAAFVLDITDDIARAEIVDRVLALFGQVNHVVNSAASFIAAGREATRTQWMRALDVNLISSALFTAALAEQMPPGSSVVNVASISAHIAQPERWTYNATKSAIISLTRGQAMDLAGNGVRVNAVSPGWIWTPEVSRAAAGDEAEARKRVWSRYHLLDRLGEASEVAEAIAFLCSDRASFITGVDLPVDGGYLTMGPEGPGSGSVFAGSE
ncbi:SDR family oxidoreductase [Rhodococcus qingshengii]|uniref:SDR family oxidoreductase n=1 Tax=Rhodococcus qingshengii TaxID=334542 RepID=UPI0036D986BD